MGTGDGDGDGAWGGGRASRAGGGVVLDLLEDAVEADDEVEAVHDEADADEAHERELLVAQRAADARRAVEPGEHRAAARLRVLAVPRDRGGRRAGDDGGEEVVKRECERGGPRADKYDLHERVRELRGRAPEAERTPKVFHLCGCQSSGASKG